MKHTFINENGNEVTFGVESSSDLVRLTANGPSSETEWEITLQEARVLHRLLDKFLIGEDFSKNSFDPCARSEYYHG